MKCRSSNTTSEPSSSARVDRAAGRAADHRRRAQLVSAQMLARWVTWLESRTCPAPWRRRADLDAGELAAGDRHRRTASRRRSAWRLEARQRVGPRAGDDRDRHGARCYFSAGLDRAARAAARKRWRRAGGDHAHELRRSPARDAQSAADPDLPAECAASCMPGVLSRDQGAPDLLALACPAGSARAGGCRRAPGRAPLAASRRLSPRCGGARPPGDASWNSGGAAATASSVDAGQVVVELVGLVRCPRRPRTPCSRPQAMRPQITNRFS